MNRSSYVPPGVALRSIGLTSVPIFVNINSKAYRSTMELFLQALCLEAAYCLERPAENAEAEIRACVRDKLDADPLTKDGFPATDDQIYESKLEKRFALRCNLPLSFLFFSFPSFDPPFFIVGLLTVLLLEEYINEYVAQRQGSR